MHALTRQQLIGIIALTLIWGVNWPVMKVGVTDFAPWTFRTLSMWLGLPVLGLGLILLKAPFRVPRAHWAELFWLTVANMLLWHEIASLAGQPVAVLYALISAAAWALGIQLMRRSTMAVSTLTITFWMTLITAIFLTLLAVAFERGQWRAPSTATWGAIAFNAVLIFGMAQALWLYLARSMPPVASTLSVMMIPILGVFTGAWWLGEVLHWQDWAAVGLMVLAIGSVLWPTHKSA